jgi:ketosteroid isomerase-like protein
MSKNPSPTQIVQTMYAAFGRGDVAGVLAHLTDNVDWRLNVDPSAPGAKQVPDFRPFRGKADAGEFFKIIGSDCEFHTFQPTTFFTADQEVAVRVNIELTVRKTGRRIKLESMHVFTFDASGRVSRFVEYLDSLTTAAAYGAVQEKK